MNLRKTAYVATNLFPKGVRNVVTVFL